MAAVETVVTLKSKCRYAGWCPFTEEGFGDAHEEAWMILNKKGLGLRARWGFRFSFGLVAFSLIFSVVIWG